METTPLKTEEKPPLSFGVEDLERLTQQIPLHTSEPGLISDSGDLCDSDCQDCD